MKKITITMVIVAFLLVGTLTFIGLNFSKNIEKYKVLEEDLKEYASMYLSINNINIGLGENIIIKSDTLIEYNIIKDLKVKDDECTGYVIATKTNKSFKYESYVKCNDYTTKNY